MPLIDDLKKLCARLAKAGWGKYLKDKHGLDLGAADLAAELVRPLTISRDEPGFEDYAEEGVRGIEPNIPARSLLYHALASPNVQLPGGKEKDYPTLAELETIENYVFGVKPPSIEEIRSLTGDLPLAIAVFAVEYRPAVDTAHGKHADLCFSRTGIARVGTFDALYSRKARGFSPLVDEQKNAIRVLPARYIACIAVQRKGDKNSFGPMRFDSRFDGKTPPPGRSDADLLFWVPVHKLFSGRECIDRFTLTVSLEAHHVNEKLRRIHLELARRGDNTGWSRPEIDNPPFRFLYGIAGFSSDGKHGQGLLLPFVHPLVAPAIIAGQEVTFRVPPNPSSTFPPTFEIAAVSGNRPAPEYVHIRHAPNENPPNLNDRPDSAQAALAGGYDAKHYLDFTGDGWVHPLCPELFSLFPRAIPAYSIVGAPDFYPDCDQREIMEWWKKEAPSSLRDVLWEPGGAAPDALSDERIPPNINLATPPLPGEPRANFRKEDLTVTAVVSLAHRGVVAKRPQRPRRTDRHVSLPDAASGVFAPGWDTSVDATGGTTHLAAYGLGSPFPEDAKLCAALSAYWPAVAPDVGRAFSVVFPTVAPMTDDEIGSKGGISWDGTAGPQTFNVGGKLFVEYANFEHVDYTDNALNNRFSMTATARVGARRYISRLVAMARAYKAVGALTMGQKRSWNVLSFTEPTAVSAELTQAQTATGQQMDGDLFRIELIRQRPAATQPADHRRVRFEVTIHRTLYVSGSPFVLIHDDANWSAPRVEFR